MLVAWHVAWHGQPEMSRVDSAILAPGCAICAGSARGALGRTSCKRQGAGSNPATGSQVSAEFLRWQECGVGRSDPRCAFMGEAGAGHVEQLTSGAPPGQAALALITLTSAVRRYSGQPALGAVARAVAAMPASPVAPR